MIFFLLVAVAALIAAARRGEAGTFLVAFIIGVLTVLILRSGITKGN